ncbi:MAG: DUF421 domain-containing protein [Clostridia bacterium]|nr:DUF421 domain-containing protein [Clostridia bacterium]
MSTVFLRLILIYFITVISIRLMGKRQIGQMQMSELVTTFFLSELAAYPITNQNVPLTYGILPVITLICIEVILSFLATKFARMKKLIDGAPSILIQKGKLNQSELARARLSIEELLSELRLKDISKLSDVDYTLLEASGKISVVKKNAGGLEHLLIADGTVNTRGLEGADMTKTELDTLLAKHGVHCDDVFLLCKTDAGDVKLIRKERHS